MWSLTASLRLGTATLAFAALRLAITLPCAKAETAPSFDLPHRGADERVRLEDFSGQILVLDFFAYWCAPCARASPELETQVQQYYSARKGNPHGLSVRVVSVNIEKDFPERTEDFLRRTGASFVVNDFAASFLKKFGSEGIPFLAIVDGSRSRPGAPRFEVVYKHSGFEGAEKMRHIIDGLGGTGAVGSRGRLKPDAVGPGRIATGGSTVHTIELNPEVIAASDILLSDTSIRYGQQFGGTQLDAAFTLTTFDEDYRPNPLPDALGFPEHLHEDRFSGLVNLRQRLVDQLTFLGTGGVYDGYPDYRRVWIANRYRQKYANPIFLPNPAYKEPDPKGWNVSAGTRWEYLPATGFAELKLGYASDQTAPGYEDSLDASGNYVLLRGREHLNTETFGFSSENVLARRLRALNEFNFTQTSGRQLRFSYQGSLNVALAERWVVRAYGGVSTEAPQFDAHFLGATVEYEVTPSLLLSVTGRYYKDTGEIENSLLTTSAAPPLKSWEAGLGLRYSWRRCALKVYVAPLWTDYASSGDASAEFIHLYANRKWVLAQIAWSVQF